MEIFGKKVYDYGGGKVDFIGNRKLQQSSKNCISNIYWVYLYMLQKGTTKTIGTSTSIKWTYVKIPSITDISPMWPIAALELIRLSGTNKKNHYINEVQYIVLKLVIHIKNEGFDGLYQDYKVSEDPFQSSAVNRKDSGSILLPGLF
ncbi:hypothetical protein ACJX0J_010142, partial [Zea mays]